MKNTFLLLFLLCSYQFSNRAFSQTAILSCTAGGLYNSNYLINNVLQHEGTCNNFNKKIQVAILDSCAFIPWNTDSCINYFGQGNYYSCSDSSNTCIGTSGPQVFFEFECNDPIQMNALVSMLNAIPYGFHILAYTYSLPNAPNCALPAPLKVAFLSLGSNMFLTVSDTVPFIFYVKKGIIATMSEISGTTASDTVSLTLTIECLPASVTEGKEIEEKIEIYPNPVVDNLTIIISTGSLEKKYLNIYNAFGEVVLNEHISSQKYFINLSGFVRGLYVVVVRSGKTIFRQKIIKE